MFDIDLMKYFLNRQFYTEEDKEKYNGTLDACVMEAWYIYCYKFLTATNEQWAKLMMNEKLFEQANLFNYITVSDHAVCQWILQTRIEDFEKASKEPKVKKTPGRQKNVKTGEHKSKKQLPLYKTIYNSIAEIYADETQESIWTIWNQYFWDKMKEHHKDYVMGEDTDKKKKRKRTKEDEDDFELPGFDPLPKQFSSITGTFATI